MKFCYHYHFLSNNKKTTKKTYGKYPNDNEILIDLSIFSRQNQFHYHIVYAHALLQLCDVVTKTTFSNLNGSHYNN